MSLLDKLADKGLDLVGDKGGAWFDKGMSKAADLVNGSDLDGDEKEAVKTALSVVGTRKASLLHLGKGGLVSVLGSLGIGNHEAARVRFLKSLENSPFDDLMAASEAAASHVIKDVEDRERAWEEVKDMAGTIARLAIPFLLAAL